MNSPKILILDEPTTGLDPLMRAAFVNIILEQKKKGATVLMSSHMFEEMEETCDYVGLIKDGHLLEIVDMEKLHKRTKREYKIEFVNQKDYEESMNLGYKIIRKQPQYNQITIQIEADEIKEAFHTFKKYELKYISEVKYTLEKYFLELVSKIEKEDGGKKDGNK